MVIDEVLRKLVEKGGSDLHIKAGLVPMLRERGELVPLEGFEVIGPDDIKQMLFSIFTDEQKQKLEKEKELDFSYFIHKVARFRGNALFQKGMMGAVFRVIPNKIPTMESLGLPPVLKELVKERQGLVLVTGPTGSGKTTTLAALINFMNENYKHHIITIEDPIEFVYKDSKSVINQREVGQDTLSFAQALRRALRQDPDVILVGEMRDQETISIAVTAAETGHLVFSTVHTNDAKQTIDRIIDTFPPDQHHQIRMQIAMALKAVVSQRLIPRKDGQGRVAILEIMLNTPTIRKLIEEGKTGAMAKAIEDSSSFYNMQSFNQCLFKLVMEDIVDEEHALTISQNPNDLKLQLQTAKFSAQKEKEKQSATAQQQQQKEEQQEQPQKPGGGLEGRFGGYKV